MDEKPIFHAASEADITRIMLKKHWAKFDEYVESDVIIVGGGPAGLVAAYYLAKNDVKVVVIERNNYLGGGMYLGGYGAPEMIVRKPGNFILDELNVPYEDHGNGICSVNAPLVAGKIIAAACEAGAFIVNLTAYEDLVMTDKNEVGGVVINWAPVQALPRQITCVDPVAIESKVVIAATGHDYAAVAERAAEIGLIDKPKGMGGMNIRASEDEVVRHTKEVYPGLILAGMEAAEHYGLHRMGPTFGAMFLSGKRAADVAMEKIGVTNIDNKFEEIINSVEAQVGN